MKGKEEGLLASKNRIRRETCAQIAHISTPHPLQGGRRFLNPPNPAIQPGFFLGKDWSLCSLFVLDFFTRFPTPGAPSPFPHLTRLLSTQWIIRREKGRVRSGTLCKNYMKISLSKEGEFCLKAAGLAMHWNGRPLCLPLRDLLCS